MSISFSEERVFRLIMSCGQDYRADFLSYEWSWFQSGLVKMLFGKRSGTVCFCLHKVSAYGFYIRKIVSAYYWKTIRPNLEFDFFYNFITQKINQFNSFFIPDPIGVTAVFR